MRLGPASLLLLAVAVAARPADAASVRVLGTGASAEADHDAALVEQAATAALRASGATVLDDDDGAAATAIAAARAQAEGGRAAYLNLEAEQAGRLLEGASRVLVEHLDLVGAKEAAAALVLLGSVRNQSGDEKGARAAFTQALTIFPTYFVEAGAIPEGDQQLFNAVQEKVVFQEQGSLKVQSAGMSGLVVVDGTPRGATPVDVHELVPGRHHVVVSRAGAGRVATFVEVSSRKPALTVPKLERSGAARAVVEALGAWRPDDAAAKDIVAAAGRLEGAAEAWLVLVDEKGGARSARILRVDRARAAVTGSIDVPIQGAVDPKAVEAAVASLLAQAGVSEAAPPPAAVKPEAPAPAVAAAKPAPPPPVDEDDGSGAGPWLVVGAAVGGVALVAVTAGVIVAVVVAQPQPTPTPLSAAPRHVVLGF